MQSRRWCTLKNVLKLCISYFIFSIIFYAFFFYPLNLFDSNGQCSFSYNNTFQLFVLNIMPPIRFVFICIIPIILMLGCGGRMLYNIQRSRQRIAQQIIPQNAAIGAIVISVSTGNNENDKHQRQTVTMDHMLLLMVLSNVVAYILTQTPFNIYTLCYGYKTSNDYISYSLTRAFLFAWSSVYFGVGFYLFCITSTQFRKQFKTKMKILCVCYRPLQH